MTCYADDLMIQCRPLKLSEQPWRGTRVDNRSGLTLHPTQTKIVDAQINGVDLSRYRFVKRCHFPRTKSLVKFRKVIRGQTRRKDGRILNTIIADINQALVS